MFFSNNFATTNLKYLKFGITHFFYVPWMIFVFSRPARPYQGQVSDLLAFVQFFFGNSQRSILKVQEFVKKVFWKNVPRLPAFKTTFSFWKNFLWSYPSKLNQIQIMWLFWPNINFHSKILAFKGQEGQERPSNFFRHKSAKQNSIAKLFIFKHIHFLFW